MASDYERWFNATKKSQEEFCQKKIGVKFGIYETVNAWFDESIGKQLVTVKCVRCGQETTVDRQIWRDWMRGKGRHQDKCKNCEKIEKEAHRAERERLAEEKRRTKEEEKRKREEAKIKYGKKEYIGKKYGHLTVLEWANGQWKCKCDCGFEKWVKPTMVAMGKTKTCGRADCKYHVHIADQGTIYRQLGEQFEKDCELFLKENGYKVKKTPTSRDYGVDLLVIGKDKSVCAFQLKHNGKSQKEVSPHAIMEVYAGAAYYECDKAFVVSTTGYSANAIHMAEKLGVMLLDEKFQKIQLGNDSVKFTTKHYKIGNDIKTRSQWCNLYHTNIKTVEEKMKALDLSFEQALQNKEEMTGQVYEINGEKHYLKYWCGLYNQSTQAINYRLRKGMDLQEALRIPGTKNGIDNIDSSIFV